VRDDIMEGIDEEDGNEEGKQKQVFVKEYIVETIPQEYTHKEDRGNYLY
jgi:hypothetical protein